MNSPTEQIKERLDLISFLQGYIKLTKAGINYKGVCPFHKEKSPSFFVSPEKQIWHCFGCGVGGDAFGFLMKFENIEFPEALRILADKAGVTLDDYRRVSYAQIDKDLYGICDFAAQYFSAVLFSPAGGEALDYLLKRGLKEETIREFKLGYIPSQSELLKKYFISRRIPIEKGEAAGLFLRKGGDTYDRFRGRIMFPIEDRLGRTVGFTGRIFETDAARLKERGEREGKYVNTPETAIFNKSKLLYGFSITKHAIREQNACVFVEGQMDFLMSYQAGLKNVVATSGTAMTQDHLTQLKYLTKRLIFVFDADLAGQHATERAIEMAQQVGFEPRIVRILEGKDPGEYFMGKSITPELFEKESIPSTDYFFHTLLTPIILRGVDGDGAQKKFVAVRAFLEKVATIASATERGHWLNMVADAARVGMEDLRRDLEEVMRKKVYDDGRVYSRDEVIVSSFQERHIATLGRLDLLFDEIVTLIMYKPELASFLSALEEYAHEAHAKTLSSFKDNAFMQKDIDPRIILMKSYLESFLGETSWEDELRRVVREYKLEAIHERIKQKNAEIGQLEKDGDEAGVATRLGEVSFLLADLRKVELEK
ncbi:MAG: DNA primase [Parcubacteria group bacterium]|nr:DNA primase [Parcubacteria group bacterium]